MAYGWRGAQNGLVAGFSMMDNYYARREGRARANRLDTESSRRWDITNERQEMAAGLGNDLKQRQIQALDDESSSNIWDSIMHDQAGKPEDFTKLDPNQLKTKKSQILQVINQTPTLRAQLANNPDVDQENPLANMDFIYDQQTKKPSAVFSLRMKDGSIKPMTEMRSGDPADNVVIMPLSDLDSQVRSLVGGKGAMATRRAAGIARGTENRKFAQEEKMEHIKAGAKSPRVETVINPDTGQEETITWDKGSKSWVPYGGTEGAPKISQSEAQNMARKDYQDKASMFKSDQAQFGMTESEWINQRTMEYMGETAPNNAPSSPQVGANNAPAGIPKEAIQQLKDNDSPEERKFFDEQFGKGAAAKVFDSPKKAPKKKVKEKSAAKKSSFMAAEAAEKPDTVKKKETESVKPKPKSVKPSPYAVQEGDKARGGITQTMAEAMPTAKRTMKQSVQQAIKTKDRKTLRKMSQKKLIEVAETLTKAEREALATLMGVNVDSGKRAVMAE